MMMKVGQPKTGTWAQSGSVGRGVGGGLGGSRVPGGIIDGVSHKNLSPQTSLLGHHPHSPGRTPGAHHGPDRFFLVSKEVLSSYYQVVRAFYIL